jgi:hypothetical protein
VPTGRKTIKPKRTVLQAERDEESDQEQYDGGQSKEVEPRTKSTRLRETTRQVAEIQQSVEGEQNEEDEDGISDDEGDQDEEDDQDDSEDAYQPAPQPKSKKSQPQPTTKSTKPKSNPKPRPKFTKKSVDTSSKSKSSTTARLPLRPLNNPISRTQQITPEKRARGVKRSAKQLASDSEGDSGGEAEGRGGKKIKKQSVLVQGKLYSVHSVIPCDRAHVVIVLIAFGRMIFGFYRMTEAQQKISGMSTLSHLLFVKPCIPPRSSSAPYLSLSLPLPLSRNPP